MYAIKSGGEVSELLSVDNKYTLFYLMIERQALLVFLWFRRSVEVDCVLIRVRMRTDIVNQGRRDFECSTCCSSYNPVYQG